MEQFDVEQFNELLTFLYPNIFNGIEKVNRSIHIILANQDKSVIGWYPGKRTKKFDWADIAKKINKGRLIGFTGRSYRDYTVAMVNQSSCLHWVAIDIDDYEITDENIEKIKTITWHKCSIRCSTGGNGIHLIYRLDKPNFFEPGVKTTSFVKYNLKPIVDRLTEAGINVCCWQGGVFYLLGGKQKWLYKTDSLLESVQDTDIDTAIDTRQQGNNIQQVGSDTLNEYGQEFFNLVHEQVPTIGHGVSIYVKDIYNQVKNTKYEFETKSPMMSDMAHVNGFLYREGNDLKLWTHADNTVILGFEAFNPLKIL